MHFLHKNEVHTLTLTRPRACVTVRLEGRNTLAVSGPEGDEPNIGIAKSGTRWAEVPERVKVTGPDGETIKPTKGKKFYVTVESFDPFHAVMEAGVEDF